MTRRARAWLEHWSPILPLLIAEAAIGLGFGALLPILPIYFTQHGVDLATLGIVVAAWPAARLVAEPLFGWVADRASRKRMMVISLALSSIVAVLPLMFLGPVAFIVLRALAGICAAGYDPAARGYLSDANLPERQGETFGLYNAAQMGGFMVGPAIGGLAAAATGEPTVVFWVTGISMVVSAILVAARVADRPRTPIPSAAAADAVAGAADAVPRPARILNTLLVAAIVLNAGSFLAGGTYEVVWSLYMTSLGASIGLIGLSFFTFSLPVMLLSPFTGRFIDTEGGFAALVLGMAGVGISGLLYPLVPNMWFVILLGLFEGSAFAFASPALYTLVARAAPAGRSSTAQGLFGAAGTVGTITASITAGILATIDLRLPFLAAGSSILVMLALGLLVGRRRLWAAMQPSHLGGGRATAAAAEGDVAEGDPRGAVDAEGAEGTT